jgi:hypothetical protein
VNSGILEVFWAKTDLSRNPSRLPRIQSEGFELLAPFCRSITKSLDSNTAGQPTFDGGPHEVWREKRERDRHVDLAQAASLTGRDLLNVCYRAGHNLVKPATTPGNCADETRPTFDPSGTNFVSGNAMREKYLPGSPGRRLLPWDRE